eukprot:scaffold116274_cov31-Tisochrysis_lutea.AAC.1
MAGSRGSDNSGSLLPERRVARGGACGACEVRGVVTPQLTARVARRAAPCGRGKRRGGVPGREIRHARGRGALPVPLSAAGAPLLAPTWGRATLSTG